MRKIYSEKERKEAEQTPVDHELPYFTRYIVIEPVTSNLMGKKVKLNS